MALARRGGKRRIGIDKDLDGQGASDPLPPTRPSGAIRYIIFLGAQRVSNCADSTEFLGISVCYPPRQPESFESGEEKKTPEDCFFWLSIA